MLWTVVVDDPIIVKNNQLGKKTGKKRLIGSSSYDNRVVAVLFNQQCCNKFVLLPNASFESVPFRQHFLAIVISSFSCVACVYFRFNRILQQTKNDE